MTNVRHLKTDAALAIAAAGSELPDTQAEMARQTVFGLRTFFHLVESPCQHGAGDWAWRAYHATSLTPAVTPKRRAWNKGSIIGQKRPLLPKQVWAIHARLVLAGYFSDLVLFNVAIDSKLRGCDLVKLAVADLVKDDRVRERVSVIQSKTKRPAQFELTENTRDSVLAWVKSPEMLACPFMFQSRFYDRSHISTR